MNTEVSILNCSHSQYHHLAYEVPEPILEMANAALTEEVRIKVTKDNLLYISHGPWLERLHTHFNHDEFTPIGNGYRLVYKVGRHQYCVHTSDKHDHRGIEIHDNKHKATEINVNQHRKQTRKITRYAKCIIL